VREVLSGQPLTHVPRSQEQILGVLSLRGEILPVVVIDEGLGVPPQTDDPTRPILVLRRSDLLVGLRVDAIQSVVNVRAAEVQPHPDASTDSLLSGIWQPTPDVFVTMIAGDELLDRLASRTHAKL
jgi:purine-binding chemotaxis protein CheW